MSNLKFYFKRDKWCTKILVLACAAGGAYLGTKFSLPLEFMIGGAVLGTAGGYIAAKLFCPEPKKIWLINIQAEEQNTMSECYARIAIFYEDSVPANDLKLEFNVNTTPPDPDSNYHIAGAINVISEPGGNTNEYEVSLPYPKTVNPPFPPQGFPYLFKVAINADVLLMTSNPHETNEPRDP